MLLLHNGQLITPSQQSIFLDRNFLHAYGVFTTIRIVDYQIIWFDEHWQRLLAHAHTIGIPTPVEKKTCLNHLNLLLQKAQCIYPNHHTFKLRLIFTAGVLQLDLAQRVQKSAWYIILEPLPDNPKQKPFTVILSPYPINEHSPLSGIKQCNYLPAILAKQHAYTQGFQDALTLNTQGFITGGTTFNLFIIKKNQLYTPHLNSGALAGITRAHIINLAKTLHIKTRECNLALNDLFCAEAIFATNSLMPIKYITCINQQHFLSYHPLIAQLQHLLTP